MVLLINQDKTNHDWLKYHNHCDFNPIIDLNGGKTPRIIILRSSLIRLSHNNLVETWCMSFIFNLFHLIMINNG